VLSLYGFDSEKGTVLWLREIAVTPCAHSNGIGSLLIISAINWRLKKGAKRNVIKLRQ
jgi:GNAT superfamily N-acetyltransferase